MADDKLIKDAQYRKGLSIAFFNATNSAISLCTGMNVHEKETIKKVIEIRDFFLKEHDEYYANVIAKVGLNYDAVKTIVKLKETKSLEDLKVQWILLSQDERQDKEIIKVVQELKQLYEKA